MPHDYLLSGLFLSIRIGDRVFEFGYKVDVLQGLVEGPIVLIEMNIMDTLYEEPENRQKRILIP